MIEKSISLQVRLFLVDVYATSFLGENCPIYPLAPLAQVMETAQTPSYCQQLSIISNFELNVRGLLELWCLHTWAFNPQNAPSFRLKVEQMSIVPGASGVEKDFQ